MDNVERLIKIIEPYSSWWRQNEDKMQEKAFEALKVFLSELMDLKPEKEYKDCGGGMHTFYVFYLLQIRHVLEQQNYVEACGELINLMLRSPFFQPRIMYNVIDLLEQYLGDKDV